MFDIWCVPGAIWSWYLKSLQGAIWSKKHQVFDHYIWAAAFIYDVAAVKKIDGVPPPRFNLVFQVSALFHHEWPRFHHEWPRFNLVLNLPRFLWSPPISFWSRFAGETNISTNPCLTPHLVFIIVNKCSCSIYISLYKAGPWIQLEMVL